MLAARNTTAIASNRRPIASCPVIGKQLHRLRPIRFKEEDEHETRQDDISKSQKDQMKGFQEGYSQREQQPMPSQQPLGQQLKQSLDTSGMMPGSRAEYAEGEPRISFFTPAFTRRREIFAGRMAMLGFFAACFWEWYLPSRPNMLEQVSGVFNRINLPFDASWVGYGMIALIVYNIAMAASPGSPTFSNQNQKDVAKRPPGPPGVWPSDFKRVLGISGWGFTKANELFAGRLAMLGFLAAFGNQLRFGGFYGPGPLAQVAAIMGRNADENFYASAGTTFALFSLFAVSLAYFRGKRGSFEGDTDIY